MKSRSLRALAPLVLSLLVALAVGLLFLSSQDSTSAQGDGKTRIVLIAGQPSHPSGQHEFNAGAIILARALNEQSGLPVDVEVIDYHEHAIGMGADARAVCYIELRSGPSDVLFGIGLDANIVTASLKAVVSAVNRHVAATGLVARNMRAAVNA